MLKWKKQDFGYQAKLDHAQWGVIFFLKLHDLHDFTLQGDKYVSERLSEAVRGHEVIGQLNLFQKLC